MKRLTSIALVATLMTTLAQGANAAVVRFASVAEFTPYNYLDDEGVLQGFEADLATLICKRAAIQCDWSVVPWDGMISGLLQGNFDVIMTGMQITTQGATKIDFSDEYFPADPSAVMVRTGGLYPGSGSVVGAQVNTLQVDYITNKGWALATYPTPENAVQGLKTGAIDALVGDQTYLEGAAAADPGVFEFAATNVVIGGGIGMGFRPNDSLKATMNTAIASLKADGTLDALIGKWFQGRDPKYRGAAIVTN